MGCHTWIYRREKFLTNEDQKYIIRKTLEDLDNKISSDDDLMEYYGYTQKDCEDYHKSVKEVKSLLKKARTFKDLNDEIIHGWLDITHLVGNKARKLVELEDGSYAIYKEIAGDDLFRVYGYPEDEFTDISKLLDWLSKYSNNNPDLVEYYDSEGNIHKGYTKELTTRIRMFAEKEGKDLLYFTFG